MGYFQKAPKKSPIAISPEEVLATKRQARISDVGFAQVNNLVKATFDVPLAPKRKLDEVRKSLEAMIDYQFNEFNDVCLISIPQIMQERYALLF